MIINLTSVVGYTKMDYNLFVGYTKMKWKLIVRDTKTWYNLVVRDIKIVYNLIENKIHLFLVTSIFLSNIYSLKIRYKFYT